jgi:PilZ domain-containing protein
VAVAQHVPRAPRYSLPITVLYRACGDSAWLEGRTENISKSGVLIRADWMMALSTPVELLLDIPPELPTPFTGTTICRGRIVRAEGPSAEEHRTAFAATIAEYETSNVVDPRRI